MKQNNTDLAVQQPNNVLSVIAEAANNPNIDAAKMREILDIQIRIMAIEAEKNFNKSLADLQAVKPTVTKHGKAIFKDKLQYTFARYEDMDSALSPLLKEFGFSYSFIETEESGRYKGTLLHKDGHSQSGYCTVPPDTSGSKNSIQAVGSARSYAKKYIFEGLLNIVTIGEDDDAQTFSYITTVQASELESLLVKYEIDKEKFLKQFGVESIDKIMANNFETLIRAINERNAKKMKVAEVAA